MPNRAQVNQRAQIGVEATSGTTVAATQQLVATSVEPGIKFDSKVFRAQGRKYSQLVVPGKEWVEAKLQGYASYTELIYWLSSAIGTVSPTTPTNAVLTRNWSFVPVLSGPATYKTFTIEKGDSTRAFKFGYGTVTDYELKFTRDAVDFTGTMIGQLISDGVSLTSSVPLLTEQPILGNSVKITMDTTSSAIGTTQLMDVQEADFKVGSIYTAYWPLVPADASFDSLVDGAPKAEFKMTVQADATGMGILTNARLGNTYYIRVSSNGPQIEAVTPTYYYNLTLDMAVKVKSISEFKVLNEVYSVEYTFEITDDSSLGKAYSIAINNIQTSL